MAELSVGKFQFALLAISHISYAGASSVAGKKGKKLEHTTVDIHLCFVQAGQEYLRIVHLNSPSEVSLKAQVCRHASYRFAAV